MSLPNFTHVGDLPLGVHPAPLTEVLSRFGVGSSQRISLGRRLERIYDLAHATGTLSRFVLFGSFVTNKLEPNDVDIFMVMQDKFDASQLIGEAALLFDHIAADTHFGASVFWVRRLAAMGGEQTAIE
jgi:hypothetical protein